MRYRPPQLPASQITDEALYLSRRRLLRGLIGAAPLCLLGCGEDDAAPSAIDTATAADPRQAPYAGARKSNYSTTETQTGWREATGYNNFYEFGTGKDDPARQARRFVTSPWEVTVAGHAEVTGTFALEDLLKPHTVEERVYRMRCVEGWSMVIPWNGIPLGDVLKRFKPTSQAKYVAFTTLLAPERMPGQSYPVLDWPYREGLRIDEAMHPLTLLAVGLYGKTLPNQNGAPLRLVVPWKYGFKGIKSIVRIEFTENQPPTSWNMVAPGEYGFYSNVNPAVDHPRWSQKSERRIGTGGIFGSRMATMPFNGYGGEVASLYAGMNLRNDF